MQPIVSDVIVDRPPRPLVMIGGGLLVQTAVNEPVQVVQKPRPLQEL